jgi:hypothetical protein
VAARIFKTYPKPQINNVLSQNFTIIGGYGATNNAAMIYSYDGVTWNISTSAGTLIGGSAVRSVAWNGRIWLATSDASNRVIYSSDGIFWNASSSANSIFTSNALCLTTDGYTWVAGGQGTNKLAYSTDGITWTASSSANAIFGTNCTAVCYGGTIWAAGGGVGGMAYSYDGITWTSTTIPSGYAIHGIAYNGTLWVAVGSNNAGANGISYSYDGINWTVSTSGSALLRDGYSVAWNGVIWVAGGRQYSSSGSIMVYSYDGINWTNISSITTSNLTYVTANSISWNGSAWFVTGLSGSSGSYKTVYTSFDGITWTLLTAAANLFIGSGYSVGTRNLRLYPQPTRILSQNFMLIGGYTAANNATLAYSYDGISWYPSPSAASVFTTSLNGIAWNGYLWVGCGAGNKIGYSSDGIFWTVSSSGNSIFSGGYCIAIATNGYMWVAGGQGTNMVGYSYDGITWYTSSSGSAIFTSICDTVSWSGSMWVAGGGGSGQIAYSTDGINWTAANVPGYGGGQINGLRYNGTMWVAVGQYVTGSSVLYSYDGITWTVSTSGSALLVSGFSVAWNGTLWVAGGQASGFASALIYSFDGMEWTACSGITSSSWTSMNQNAIAWNGSLWIVTATNGGTNYRTVYTSRDGINWSLQTSASNLFITFGYCAAARIFQTYPRQQNAMLGGTGQSSSGGTLAVNFRSTVFSNSVPTVTATVSGSGPAHISVGSIGPTGFTATTYNITGTQTGPVSFNWHALDSQ